MGIVEIFLKITKNALNQTFVYLGTTAPGFRFVPIAYAAIAWSRSKKRSSMKTFKDVLINALGAAVVVWFVVFSFESFNSFRAFWNTPMVLFGLHPVSRIIASVSPEVALRQP